MIWHVQWSSTTVHPLWARLTVYKEYGSPAKDFAWNCCWGLSMTLQRYFPLLCDTWRTCSSLSCAPHAGGYIPLTIQAKVVWRVHIFTDTLRIFPGILPSPKNPGTLAATVLRLLFSNLFQGSLPCENWQSPSDALGDAGGPLLANRDGILQPHLWMIAPAIVTRCPPTSLPNKTLASAGVYYESMKVSQISA